MTRIIFVQGIEKDRDLQTQYFFFWCQFRFCHRLPSITLFHSRSFPYIIVVRDPFSSVVMNYFKNPSIFSVLSMISRWKLDPLHFSWLNHVISKCRLLFVSSLFSNDLKLFFVFVIVIKTSNIPDLLNFLHDLIELFSHCRPRVRCIIDIKISRLKTSWTSFVLHVLIFMSTHVLIFMSINIAKRFSNVKYILFFCNKILKCALIYFRSFSREITYK